MKDNTETIYNILPLLETIEESFSHIQQQLSQLRYEEALGLLEDAMMGILSIEEAIKPIVADLKDHTIGALGEVLKVDMAQVVTSYETGAKEGLEKQIQEKVLLSFRNWKVEIEGILRPYVMA